MEEQIRNSSNLIKALLVGSLISLWCFWLWSRRALYRFAFGFPGFFGFPILGCFNNLKDFKEILQVLNNFFERTKSNTMCVWMGLYPTLVSSDPEFIEKILSSPEFYNKGKSFYTPLYEVFKGGMVSSPGKCQLISTELIHRAGPQSWSTELHNRKIINPSFHHKVLVSFLPVFEKGKNVLLSKFDKMANKGEHKLYDIIQRVTLGTAVETTMGQMMGPGDQAKQEIITNFRYALEKVVLHMTFSCLNLGWLFRLHFKYRSVKERLYKFVMELVEAKLQTWSTQKPAHSTVSEMNSFDSIKKSPNIFIDQAIENYRKQKLTLNDVIVESNNIVAGSFETTSNGTLSVLFMLATHPAVQERLYEEIINIFPEKSFEMKLEHLDQLPYLDMVINETLRLAPSIPLIVRHVTNDTALSSNLVLPEGLQFMVSIFHVHRRKDIWGPNANNFDPDNFLPANIAGKHPYAFIPFSKGMRNCIGWRYALFSMKVILAGIVRNYRLTTSLKYEDVKFTYSIFLKYLNEPSFKIYRRE